MKPEAVSVRSVLLLSLVVGLCAGVATVFSIVQNDWPVALAMHCTAAVFSGIGLKDWLRRKRCSQYGLFNISMFMIALVPGFTLLALPVAMAYGANNPATQDEDNTLVVEVPQLPFKPLVFDQSLSFSRGGLFEVLERSSDIDKQLVAVMATTRMKAKQAIPLLKVAMRDNVDDVRLLAYSIKDKKESEINSKIKRLMQRLNADDDNPGMKILGTRERAATERSLAFLYWELVYLDLAEGDIRAFFLEQVVTRASAALGELSYGPLAVVLARARLEQGEYSAASAALLEAERSGVDRLVLAPYRAEIAFQEGRFHEVRNRLQEVGSSPHEALREVLDYWLKTA